MKANPRTIDDLFNSQLRYVVPMFQRLYVWQENPQWSTLWEDVVEKAELQLDAKRTNPHYLGALIIEGVRPSSPREVKRFLVIDGQQRLTTLQLLICAYRDLARRYEWRTLDRATTRYIENADPDVMEHPEEEVLKLWPTTLNRDVFKAIVTAGSRESVEAAFPIVWKRRRRKAEPRNNLIEAYLYFAASLESWLQQAKQRTGKTAEECAFALLQSLQQDFSVVEIALAEGDDSQEIFYSLNSQGRPLSQSDLLRSLIFMRAEKEKLGRDLIFDEYWSRFETPYWSEEIKRGGRSYSRLDLGLRFFLMAKTGALVDARRVNEEYRHWISTQPPRYPSVRDELADFTRHAARYQWYDSAAPSDLPSTDLRRVLTDFDVSTALPLFIYLELDAGLSDDQQRSCSATLESFIARRLLIGEETKEYNKLFVELVGAIKEVPTPEVPTFLERRLLAGGGATRNWPSDAQVLEAAISRPVGREIRTPALRLILERLEIALRTKKSEGASIVSGLQIEHIMPNAWWTYWPIDGVAIPPNVALAPFLATSDQSLANAIRSRNQSVQTIGNLTLLNEYLNPAANNGSYEMKRVEYRNSVLRLNRYFDQCGVWNEDAIQTRGRQLGTMLCQIWPRPSLPSR